MAIIEPDAELAELEFGLGLSIFFSYLHMDSSLHYNDHILVVCCHSVAFAVVRLLVVPHMCINNTKLTYISIPGIHIVLGKR